MENCKLGISGAEKIGYMVYHNATITSINLGANGIGDDGVERLVQQLRDNTTLEHLDLHRNNITDVGAKYLQEFLASSSLNNIELSYNPLGNEGVEVILQSLTTTMNHVGLVGTGMTSCCTSVPKALHKVKSISFTVPTNCSVISDNLGDTDMLEHVEFWYGKDAVYDTLISGIGRNSSITQLS